jgi:hypothetical protein
MVAEAVGHVNGEHRHKYGRCSHHLFRPTVGLHLGEREEVHPLILLHCGLRPKEGFPRPARQPATAGHQTETNSGALASALFVVRE